MNTLTKFGLALFTATALAACGDSGKSADSKPTTVQTAEGEVTLSGKYAETVLGTVKWNVTVDSLVSVTKGHTSANLFRQLAAAGTVVDMKIAAFSITEKPAGKEIAIGAISYQGNVTVGEVSESSARGEYATFSATLNGSGPLKDGAGNEVGTPAALAALTAGG